MKRRPVLRLRSGNLSACCDVNFCFFPDSLFYEISQEFWSGLGAIIAETRLILGFVLGFLRNGGLGVAGSGRRQSVYWKGFQLVEAVDLRKEDDER